MNIGHLRYFRDSCFIFTIDTWLFHRQAIVQIQTSFNMVSLEVIVKFSIIRIQGDVGMPREKNCAIFCWVGKTNRNKVIRKWDRCYNWAEQLIKLYVRNKTYFEIGSSPTKKTKKVNIRIENVEIVNYF